jgi:hypothetical protein
MASLTKSKKISKVYLDEFIDIQDNVESAVQYFRRNVQRYNRSRNFIFNTSLTATEIASLEFLNVPPLQFNVLEAYVSRLKGEWSKQTPSFRFHSLTGSQTDDVMTLLLGGHFQAIMEDANKRGFSDSIYGETLSGGFSVMEVVTDYEGPKSFNQKIELKKVYDPTLTYFDPMARLPSKSDGRYAGRLFPMKRADFEAKYPNIDCDNITCSKSSNGFQWSYRDGTEEVVLIADHYQRKTKLKKIYMLADGKTYDQDEYNQLLDQYQNSFNIEVAPSIVKTRMAETETVVRYRFIGGNLLEVDKTVFDSLPLIFVDGNSAILNGSQDSEDGSSQSSYQMTRSYFHNAMDAQRLKNYAGQKLAAELESIVAHKFMADVESIPDKYVDAWIMPQKESTLLYQSRNKNGDPLPMPAAVPRAPIPPEITGTYIGADQTIQSILGSYDASLGIQNNQLSGVAIVEGATQSNAAAMPFVMNYMAALQQASTVILEIIPKLYKTPRTIPVINKDGERAYFKINDPEDPESMLDFEGSTLGISVTAGPNYQVQKSKALDTVIKLMQAVPAFGEMINTQPGGMSVIIDNLDIKGSDYLKSMAADFQEQQQQQKEAAQNQPPPVDPMIQVQMQAMQMKNQIDNRTLDLKQQELSLKAQIAVNENQMSMQKHASSLQKQMFDEEIESGQLQINAMVAENNAKADQQDYLTNLAELEAKRTAEMSSIEGKKIEEATAMVQNAHKLFNPEVLHEE